MSDSTHAALDELSFEAALAELDQVVAALEGGQLELEESIERYQRGVGLLRSLQGKLADAQQKVTMLVGELEAEASEEVAASSSPDAAVNGGEDVAF
jgi:exodeoxyribonuclease VII small subunit